MEKKNLSSYIALSNWIWKIYHIDIILRPKLCQFVQFEISLSMSHKVFIFLKITTIQNSFSRVPDFRDGNKRLVMERKINVVVVTITALGIYYTFFILDTQKVAGGRVKCRRRISAATGFKWKPWYHTFCIQCIIRPKKKICVFTVTRPTLFFSRRP